MSTAPTSEYFAVRRTTPHTFAARHRPLPRQTGVTLIELMVGLLIGLLVVGVAMAALMLSRGISGTVSDASQIQQQGAYLLRVMGQQLRQAGSLNLNTERAGGTATDPLSAAVFVVSADGGNGYKQQDTISGTGSKFTTGFMRFNDDVFLGADADGKDFLSRNCMGLPANTSVDTRVESIFSLDGSQLECAGNGGIAQPMAQNIAQFEVTYMVQTVAGGTGTTIQYVKGGDMPTATDDPQWRRVQGVQVCLVLYGKERVNVPADGTSTYTDCDGTKVDITALTGDRQSRMHLLFRNTYQLRSQGLLEGGA